MMRKTTITFVLVAVTAFLCIATNPVMAANEIGRTVAVRGKVTIERNKRIFDAKVKAPVELSDIITTTEASKIKLLFSDDSVLTLAEKSKMSVKEYVHSKDTRGKSVYNLLDGKMRAVVGKTKFEVQTPTAVAAARGTVIYFEVGSINGVPFTRIICLEGTVGVKNTVVAPAPGAPAGTQTPVLPATLELTPGTMVTVFAGQALPVPIPAPPALIEKLKQDTATKVSATDPAPTTTGPYELPPPVTVGNPTDTPTGTPTETPKEQTPLPVIELPSNITTPPVNQQPPTQYKGVRIRINIPQSTTPPPPTGSTGGSGSTFPKLPSR